MLKGACTLFLLSGFLSLGSAAFGCGRSNRAPAFATKRYELAELEHIRPVLRPSSSKLRSSLPNGVPASINGIASSSSLAEKVTINLAWLKQRFNFSEDLLNRIALTYPSLLILDQSVLVTRANWLQKRLKMNNGELRTTIQRFPNVLACRPDTNLGPTLDFLQEILAFNTKTLSRVVQKQPSMLGCDLIQTLQPKLNWMQSRLHLNKTTTMRKFVVECPTIFNLRIDNLETKLKWLQQRLHLTEPQIAKVFVKAPRILACNIDDNLEPTLNWLEERLDLNQTQLGKMIRRAPSTLQLRVDSIEAKINWLQQRLCLDDRSVKKIVTSQPAVLHFSTSMKLEPTLQWLQERLSLVEDGDVGKLVRRCPSLLGLNITTNLEPTLDFVKECIGAEAAVNLVVKYPVVLLVSLEKRLKPRLEQAQQIGIQIDAACVSRIAHSTEETWHKSLIYQSKKLKLEDTSW